MPVTVPATARRLSPRRDKENHLSTTITFDKDNTARVERLKKALHKPMNQVVYQALDLLERLVIAQQTGKRLKIDEDSIFIIF